MNQLITPEIKEIMEAALYRPAITVILPFEPKMSLKSELSYSLKTAVDRVEKEVNNNYPAEVGILIMQKLRTLIKGLNFNTSKKSIAIYVSPLFEKVLYLDIPVGEKIVVGDSFQIRDLIYAKKQLHKYLVLLLSFNECQVYLGNSDTLIKIVSNSGSSANDYANDVPERVANFSDITERKEILMDKFLHHIDNNLNTILNAYRLPLFVIGTKRIAGHFKKMTRHENAVIAYIHGNYETADSFELKKILKPYITDWRTIRNTDLMNQLEEASGSKKLATGIHNVWREAIKNKGRLLIVEKDYIYPAIHGDTETVIYGATEPYNKFSYIHDAVDKLIENVLESGGDIEFVDKDVLKDYDHIALVQYY
jgi:Bacterial archaeo-eukaryotic release factor family 3